MDKQELRKEIRNRKRQFSQDQLGELSLSAISKLRKHPKVMAAHTLLLYYSLPDEVNTHRFLGAWGQAKRLLLPVVQGEDLVLRQYRPHAPLQCGAYHIAEPLGEAFTSYADIQLIVVPGVAFDAAGHRLGRGKGYYDRFLSQPQLLRVPTIGICYPCQLLAHVPVEPHDVCIGKVYCGLKP